MTISSITRLAMATMGAIIATNAPLSAEAMPLYTPSDSIFGQHDSVAHLPPEVVFGYLYTCASAQETGESVVAAEFIGDCRFKQYVQAQFPAPSFGNICTAPSIEYDDIFTKLQQATSLCPDDDETSSLELSALAILQVFEAESCWASLCEDATYLHIESHFLETCAGIELPYPADHESSSANDKEAEDDAVLTCMLDQAMKTPASHFGLAESSIQCFPPGHNDVPRLCLDALATPVYSTCRKIVFDDDIPNDDMDYDMSMDLQSRAPSDEGDEDAMVLRERFCSIIYSLVRQQGLACLVTLCSTDESSPLPTLPPVSTTPDTPTQSPSTASSRTTDTPILSPSTAPSPSPSNSPSALPTLDRVQKIVGVQLEAGFSLEVVASSSDLPLPEQMNDVVEDSIKDSLMSADFGNVTVSVTKIAGNPVRRRLQTIVPLEFMVQVTDECHYLADSCDLFASNLIDSLDSVLESAVTDGSMTLFVQDQARLKSAEKLKTASVIASSYRKIGSDYETNDPVTVTTPTSASACISVLMNLVMLAVPVLLHM